MDHDILFSIFNIDENAFPSHLKSWAVRYKSLMDPYEIISYREDISVYLRNETVKPIVAKIISNTTQNFMTMYFISDNKTNVGSKNSISNN
jgi:cell shape-determining protein MreC